MTNIILRTNATPVYAFLSLINASQMEGETFHGKKILDCGAGGVLPPLALFHQQGFDTWGIDVSRSEEGRVVFLRCNVNGYVAEVALWRGERTRRVLGRGTWRRTDIAQHVH